MKKKLIALLCGALFSTTTLTAAEACTRVTFFTNDNVVVTGRNMDWDKDDLMKFHIFPRNVQRQSDGNNPFSWEVKYGSVVAYSFNGNFANSGMNEKGLQADLLYLGETRYDDTSLKEKSIAARKLIQYILDHFATVEEAKKALETKPLHIIDGNPSMGLHFIVTDPHGDNMILEIINGELVFHSRSGNVVMTNDPNYEVMTKIYDYYKEKDLSRNMPGSPGSVDRFMRAAGWLEQLSNDKNEAFIKLVPGEEFAMQARMSVLSLMRNVSTPFAISTEKNPENSTTVWREVSDLKNKVMMFDLAGSPSTVWIDLKQIDFSQGEKVFSLSDGKIKQGDITHLFTAPEKESVPGS